MIIRCTVPGPFWKRIVLFILFFYKDNSASGKPACAVRILMYAASLSHTYSTCVFVGSQTKYRNIHKPSYSCRNTLTFSCDELTA